MVCLLTKEYFLCSILLKNIELGGELKWKEMNTLQALEISF